MRGATECAKRLKLYFSTLRSTVGKVTPPPVSDPITQLILGILSRDVPESKAAEGLERLRGMVVDYNELRVVPSFELNALLEDFPDSRGKGEDIARALNAVFAREHDVSLERLRTMSKRDVVDYLDGIDGIEPYTAARVRLFGFEQHAIPLDAAMWALARQAEIVAPKCGLQEAQQFLERRVAEGDALEFFALLNHQAWIEFGSAVRKGEVESISSVPPDRTSRHMLASISGAASAAAEKTPPVEPDEPAEEKPSRPKKTPKRAPATKKPKKPKPDGSKRTKKKSTGKAATRKRATSSTSTKTKKSATKKKAPRRSKATSGKSSRKSARTRTARKTVRRKKS